jgi:hypothetical protein
LIPRVIVSDVGRGRRWLRSAAAASSTLASHIVPLYSLRRLVFWLRAQRGGDVEIEIRKNKLKEKMAFKSRRSTRRLEEKRGRSEEEAQMAPKGRNSEDAMRLWQSMPVECSAGMVRSNAITMGRRLERMFIFFNLVI